VRTGQSSREERHGRSPRGTRISRRGEPGRQWLVLLATSGPLFWSHGQLLLVAVTPAYKPSRASASYSQARKSTLSGRTIRERDEDRGIDEGMRRADHETRGHSSTGSTLGERATYPDGSTTVVPSMTSPRSVRCQGGRTGFPQSVCSPLRPSKSGRASRRMSPSLAQKRERGAVMAVILSAALLLGVGWLRGHYRVGGRHRGACGRIGFRCRQQPAGSDAAGLERHCLRGRGDGGRARLSANGYGEAWLSCHLWGRGCGRDRAEAGGCGASGGGTWTAESISGRLPTGNPVHVLTARGVRLEVWPEVGSIPDANVFDIKEDQS
jgi:hypothetical protein